MEDKELNELNDDLNLPDDGSQPDFDAVDEQIEADFKRADEEIEADFKRVDEEIEEKMEAFGEEMERVAEKIGEAFENAFSDDVDEDGDKFSADVNIHVDNPGKTVHNPARGGGQAIFWGLAMVAVGAAIILSQLGLLDSGYNWWAIFVLVPGFGFFSGALDMLITKRRLSSGVRSMFGTGLLVLTVGGILLFDLNWGIYWTLILIVVGFSMFLNGFADKKEQKGPISRWFNRFGWWMGLAVAGLGTAFLLKYLGVFSLSGWYSEWALQFTSVTNGWWGLFLLLPGIGGLLHSLIIILTARRFPFTAILLAVLGVGFLSVGVVAALGLKWNLITPFVVFGAGLVIVLGEILHQIVRDRKKEKASGNQVEGHIVD